MIRSNVYVQLGHVVPHVEYNISTLITLSYVLVVCEWEGVIAKHEAGCSTSTIVTCRAKVANLKVPSSSHMKD